MIHLYPSIYRKKKLLLSLKLVMCHKLCTGWKAGLHGLEACFVHRFDPNPIGWCPSFLLHVVLYNSFLLNTSRQPHLKNRKKKKVWLSREERKTRKNWLMTLMLWTRLHFQSEMDTCIKTVILQVWKPEGKKSPPNQWIFFLHVKANSVRFS